MRPRVKEAADIVLKAKVGVRLSTVAARMGIATSTAQTYLKDAKAQGVVRASSIGCKAVWLPADVVPPPHPPRASSAPVPSVWELGA